MSYDNNNSGVYPHLPPQYQHSQQPVILEQPVHVVVSPPPVVGPDPCMVMCPSCHANVMTRIEYEATVRTHLAAGILCLLGCWPCVCIPYCMDSCQNANHYCPACSSYIGSHRN